MATTHSRFGGSSAPRYLACPGSVALLATLPDPEPADGYAAEGTWAHAIAAWCLEQDIRDTSMLAHQSLPFGCEVPEGYHGKIVDKDTAAAVQVYLDEVFAELDKTDDAELYIEEAFEFPLDSAPGEVFGMNDALVYHPSLRRLVAFDYKHGVGSAVEADDNQQLKFYATGAIFGQRREVSEIELVIVQPRSWQSDLEPVRRWPMPTFELLEFLDEVDGVVSHVKKIEAAGGWMKADFKAGPHCEKTFCRARGTGKCPAYVGQATEALGKTYEELLEIQSPSQLPDPKTLDTDELARLLNSLDIVHDWLGQVQKYVEAILLAGGTVPGWKVVEKLGRRKWTSADEDVAVYAETVFGLEEDIVRPRKLATLTEVERLLKQAGATKEQIDSFMLKFTIKESSGRTIAPASDKRPAVDAVASDFASVKI